MGERAPDTLGPTPKAAHLVVPIAQEAEARKVAIRAFQSVSDVDSFTEADARATWRTWDGAARLSATGAEPATHLGISWWTTDLLGERLRLGTLAIGGFALLQDHLVSPNGFDYLLARIPGGALQRIPESP